MKEKLNGADPSKKLLPDVGDSAFGAPSPREEIINDLEWFNPETPISDEKYTGRKAQPKKTLNNIN